MIFTCGKCRTKYEYNYDAALTEMLTGRKYIRCPKDGAYAYQDGWNEVGTSGGVSPDVVAELKKEIEKQKELVVESSRKVIEMREKLKESEQNLQNALQDRNKLLEELELAEADLAQAKQDEAALKEELRVAKEEMESLQKQIEGLENLSNSNKELLEEIAQLKEIKEGLEDAKLALEEELENQKEEVLELEFNLAQTQEDYDRLNAMYENLEKAKNSLESNLESAREQLEISGLAVKELEARSQELEEEVRQANDTIEEKEATLKLLNKKREELEVDYAASQESLLEEKASHQRTKGELREAAAHLEEISAHIAREDNPHKVTKAQVGLDKVANYPVASEEVAKEGTSSTHYMTPLTSSLLLEKELKDVEERINKHESAPNPHNITKKDIGLGNVDNFKTATRTEAEEGTGQLFMTSELTAHAIEAQANKKLEAHLSQSNPHGLTKEDIGLDKVGNYPKAGKAQVDSRDDESLISPLGASKIAQEEAEKLIEGIDVEVSKEAVGLDKVANYPMASVEDTVKGESEEAYTSPKGVRSAVVSEVEKHKKDTLNPHKVTKAQVGLGNVRNVAQITEGEAVSIVEEALSAIDKKFVGLENVKNEEQATKKELEYLKNEYIPGRIHTMVNVAHGNVSGSEEKSGHLYLTDKITEELDSTKKFAASPKSVSLVDSEVKELKKEVEELGTTGSRIPAIDKEEPKEAYPTGITTHYVSKNGDYPQNFGTALNVKASDLTMLQFFSENNFSQDRRELYFRQLHDNEPNAEFRRILTEDDKRELASTITEVKKSDVSFREYPLGVSVFYTDSGDNGFPNRVGTVMTVRDFDRTALQIFARNGYVESAKYVWYRFGHYLTGWTDWYQVADNRDISEVKNMAEEALQLGDEVKKMLVDTLSSKGLNVSTNSTFEEIDTRLSEADFLQVKTESFDYLLSKNKDKLIFPKNHNIEQFIGYVDLSMSWENVYYYFGVGYSKPLEALIIYYMNKEEFPINIYPKETSQGMEYLLPEDIVEKLQSSSGWADRTVYIYTERG